MSSPKLTQKQLKEQHSIWKSAWLKTKLINVGIYCVSVVLLFLINYFSVLQFKASAWIFLDLFLMIFIASPIFFFDRTMFDRIYLPIMFGLDVILITVNINYYKFFGSVFTIRDFFFAFNNINQAWYYIKQWNWVITAINIVLLGLNIAAIEVFNIRFAFKETKQHKYPKSKAKFLLAGAVMGGSLLTYEFSMGMWVISQKSKSVDSIKYVNYNSNMHFRNLGMLSFYVREIRQLLTDKGVSDEDIKAWLEQSYLVQDNFTAKLDKPNVFVIMIETGDKYMFNQYTTPNLWKLCYGDGNTYKGGINAAHNYSYNHTPVSNAIGATGCYPTSLLQGMDHYYMPFALPQILKEQNYNTRFYYDCITQEDGYSDMLFAKTLGYDNCFYHNELLPGVEPWHYAKKDYIRDSIVAESIIKNLTKFHTDNPKTPICSQWMTMCMHMENVACDDNKQLIDGLYADYGPKLKQIALDGKWSNPCDDDDSAKRYEIWTLKCMDFDKALGQLMNFFYESNDPFLQNTILVGYGDHAWYEIGGGEKMCKKIRHMDQEDNINLYSTVLSMYHPQLSTLIDNDSSSLFKGHDLLKMTSPACIVPSILDLMGIPYINNLYQDQSIFDLCGKSKYDKNNDEIYYSAWLNMYLNENYTSTDGATISRVVKENGTSKQFIEKVNLKLKQLRIIDSIFYNHFFKRNNYKDLLPKSELNKINKEVMLVKHYE